MKSKTKQWDNAQRARDGHKKYVTWTARITWYEDSAGNVRLKEEHPEGVINKHYIGHAEAQVEWVKFKNIWGIKKDGDAPPPA
jgi:hypothetical protein